MLTESERRGALVVVALLVLGAGYDLWRTRIGTPPVGSGPVAPTTAAQRSEEPAAEAGPRATPGLDLNRATIAELDRLPGIGPTLARRIVDHRSAHGPFREVGELLAVRGIGPRLLARIEPLIAVAGPRDGPGPGHEPVSGSHPERP